MARYMGNPVAGWITEVVSNELTSALSALGGPAEPRSADPVAVTELRRVAAGNRRL